MFEQLSRAPCVSLSFNKIIRLCLIKEKLILIFYCQWDDLILGFSQSVTVWLLCVFSTKTVFEHLL